MNRPISAIFLLSSVVVLLSGLTGCSKKQEGVTAKAGASDTLKDSSTQAITANPDSLLTYEQRQGKVLFRKYCAICHGDDGKGDGFNAYNLDPKPRDFTDATLMHSLTDDRIFRVISGGGRSVNKSSLMPSWGGRLQKDEINYLVTYVRSFCPQK